MIYFISLLKQFKTSHVINLNSFEKLYQLYSNYYTSPTHIQKENSFLWVKKLGSEAYLLYKAIENATYFIGKIFYYFIYSMFNLHSIRFKAMLSHIHSSGVQALFIIALTSFLVGVVIAYQSAVQLQKFGANIFIVEMITITMFREIAPLMTAIVVAGRTASSYTAEIGAMKITQEVDAMNTMGFEPSVFLTLPRVFALIIALPLLIFFADIISVSAGAIVALLDLNISFSEFIQRMQETVAVKHFVIGIVKGVFFGIAIALIGCYRGFQVQNSTTSIGKYTTISVVNAIFIVIALNAIFSVILTQSGI
jgi:phospholipid/cholesterol/gamma-HCH transport system permease protein